MSRAAAFALKADSSSVARGAPAGLRVSKPGDAQEVEADRVAESVVHGGRVSGWSLSTSTDGAVQRDENTQGTSSVGEVAGKVAEALLATPKGKQAVDAVTSEITTPTGLAVTGAAVVGIVTGLAKAKKPLPAQLPAIPLDFVKPGLSAKLDYEGPVNAPTSASITLSFTPKAAHAAKGPSASERMRAETARIAADQAQFRAGMTVKGGGAGATDDKAFEEYQRQAMLKRMGSLLQVPGKTAGADVGKAPSAPAKVEPLKAPGAAPPASLKAQGPGTPTLELKPLPGLKDELNVQRKVAADTESEATGVADVDAVVRSPGKPLDASTRREMESRFGYGFERVRVHTDARAAESAQNLNARAYTVGSNVVFGSGQYAPESTHGRRLLAHELTHVLQQTGTPAQARAGVHLAPKMVQRHWWNDLYDEAKEWVLNKVRGWRGYPLICAVMGEDIFSGEKVERSATTILKGVLNLFDAGAAIWEKLQQVGNAIETAYRWLMKRIDELGLSWDYFKAIPGRIYDAVEWRHPHDSWDRVLAILEEPIDKLLTLAADIGRKVLDFIFQAALSVFGDTGRKVYEFLQKAGAVFGKIFAHPIDFAKNLLTAVVDGFKNFGAHILDHLKKGLSKWIFGELDVKGLTAPEDFSLKSIFKLLLQVLGLTYDQKRPLLVEKLGEPAVYFFETTGKVLTRVQKEGFSAIKDMIAEQADSIFESLKNSLENWVAKEIVTAAIGFVVKLSNPVGELIEAVRSIYEMVMFVIDKAQEIGKLISSVVDALGDIADGNTGPASQKVEDALEDSIPLVLRFMAGLLHLSGIGKSIRDIIHKIRAPIDNVIAKVLYFIVDKAKGLWDTAKEGFLKKLDDIKEWWNKPQKFLYDDEEHELIVEGDGAHPEVFVKSEKTALAKFLSDHHATKKQKDKALALAKKLHWNGKGKPQTVAKDEEGYKAFTQLRDLMDKLKGKVPESEYHCEEEQNSGFGGGSKAWAFLTTNRRKGSSPSGTDPAVWEDLGYLRAYEHKHYVRGHLISEKLGGPGQWSNMTPITNGSNQRMEKKVEGWLKEHTEPGVKGKERHFYRYQVAADYRNVRVPTTTGEIESAAMMAKADKAERRLHKVSWTVREAEVNDEGKWVLARGSSVKDENGSEAPPEVKNYSFDPTVRKED